MSDIDKVRAIAKPATSQDLRRLGRRVSAYLELIEEYGLDHDTVDRRMGEQIAASLQTLIKASDGFDADQRALLRGAIEYFILTEDDDDDLQSVTGLRDDAAVLDAVCDELGRSDLRVELD